MAYIQAAYRAHRQGQHRPQGAARIRDAGQGGGQAGRRGQTADLFDAQDGSHRSLQQYSSPLVPRAYPIPSRTKRPCPNRRGGLTNYFRGRVLRQRYCHINVLLDRHCRSRPCSCAVTRPLPLRRDASDLVPRCKTRVEGSAVVTRRQLVAARTEVFSDGTKGLQEALRLLG